MELFFSIWTQENLLALDDSSQDDSKSQEQHL